MVVATLSPIAVSVEIASLFHARDFLQFTAVQPHALAGRGTLIVTPYRSTSRWFTSSLWSGSVHSLRMTLLFAVDTDLIAADWLRYLGVWTVIEPLHPLWIRRRHMAPMIWQPCGPCFMPEKAKAGN